MVALNEPGLDAAIDPIADGEVRHRDEEGRQDPAVEAERTLFADDGPHRVPDPRVVNVPWDLCGEAGADEVQGVAGEAGDTARDTARDEARHVRRRTRLGARRSPRAKS